LRGYRYFLALSTPPEIRDRIDALRVSLGLTRKAIARERLHMTLAVIAMQRDRPCLEIGTAMGAALRDLALPGYLVRLDMRQGGMLVCSEGPRGFAGLQRLVLHRLFRCGIGVDALPFRPHVSLSHDGGSAGRHPIAPIEWQARYLELIESHLGESRHVPVRSWRIGTREMRAPRQLGFWEAA